jgi:hypothetical protein
MSRVAFHPSFSTDRSQSELAAIVNRRIHALPRRPDVPQVFWALSRWLNVYWTAACHAHAVHRPAAEVASYLERALGATMAGTYSYLSADDAFRVELSDGMLWTLPRRTKNEDQPTVAVRWGLFMASVLRDVGAIDALRRLPMEWLQTAPGQSVSAQDADYRLVQALILRDPSAPNLLLEAVRMTDPNRIEAPFGDRAVREELIDFVLREEAPRHEMIMALFDRDEARFNARLERALHLHVEALEVEQKNWPERAGYAPPDHLFSLPLNGLCAIAHDLGIHTTIQSDYLSPELIRGEHRSDVMRMVVDGVRYGPPPGTAP